MVKLVLLYVILLKVVASKNLSRMSMEGLLYKFGHDWKELVMDNKRCSSYPYHSGNSKGSRSSVSGTRDKNQIYISYYHSGWQTQVYISRWATLNPNILRPRESLFLLISLLGLQKKVTKGRVCCGALNFPTDVDTEQ